jgi:uncharacterized membrane protein
MNVKGFLEGLDHHRIVESIRQAEGRSRGEVRVHVSHRAVADAQAAAERQFERLGMTRTAERNGVLLFVAPESRAFALVGDRGIHERCGPEFWKAVASAVEEDFRAGRYTDGIVKGVARVGEALAAHFPRPEGSADTNELPDDVTED